MVEEEEYMRLPLAALITISTAVGAKRSLTSHDEIFCIDPTTSAELCNITQLVVEITTAAAAAT